MKTLVTILFFCFILISCNQTQPDNSIPATNKDSIDNRIKDSLQYVKDSIDYQEPDYEQLKQECINDYTKIERLDTSFTDNQGNQIQVLSKYYCLFDNALVIPGIYNWSDSTKIFQTHNFSNDIQIIINKDTIFNKTISKKMFADKLFPELKQYAILFSPNFSFNQERKIFNFEYSISIPLTDVGVGLSLQIDEKGTILKADK